MIFLTRVKINGTIAFLRREKREGAGGQGNLYVV